jgi:hypothetical protein
MSVNEIKDEIRALPPEELDQVAALILDLRRSNDPKQKSQLTEMIDDLTVTTLDKVALMESLWQDLSADSDIEPPEWHQAVLKERENEWGQREQVSQDWSDAKKELRSELP